MEEQRTITSAPVGVAPPAGPTFTHLHLHTEYSLLDGGNQIDKLLDRLVELGMTSCAITDHGNIFGAVAFYLACKEKKIKPILGVEAYVTPPGKPRTDRTYSGGGEGGYHLVLLAMNNAGWKNLLTLCSQAYLTGFYYKPRIDRELLEKHSEGLIAINGHLGSEIGDHLLAFSRSNDPKHWDAAVESAYWHMRTFGGDAPGVIPRFYVELQHHIHEQNSINPLLIKLARQVGAPLVCDNDAHFLREEDHDTHDTLICISTAKGKRDEQRMRYPRELFVKSPAQMHGLFAGEAYNNSDFGDAGKEALKNTVRIADACDVTLPIGANHAPMVRVVLPAQADLPSHDAPSFAGDLSAWYAAYCSKFELQPFRDTGDATALARAKADCDIALRMLAQAGFVWRYGRSALDKFTNDPQHAEKIMRLERELTILADKNISAYFLIVWDFVHWGRGNGVPALARGSGVGAMVGYVLGLSNACPVRFGLLFERFTDPDRSEYPDIDIDLCQDGRGKVIEYVRSKYGHVAQIITFGTLKARAAIKDVGRVLEMPLADVDRVSKLVPETLGITIEQAVEQEPELKKLAASDPAVRELLDQAIGLEGHTRHAGVHAAGVIVATTPLHNIVPLYKPPGSDEDVGVVTQWDGPTCEKMGLLKMDFLGLRTISVIERAKKLIRETMQEVDIWKAVGRDLAGERSGTHGAESPAITTPQVFAHPLDLDRLACDDQRVLDLFRRGETTGIFQFESGGMRRLLVEMKPDRLEDLIAANALFRPGPMDLIPDYNRRKHGTEEVPKVHPIVDRFTLETHGVMVYQEQVMQIVHGLGGITLRDAYSLIKAISKKKIDKIEKERPKFIQGAVKKGLAGESANELFELILKFAGYGFNKSHSTGYAIVAYQTAYLKTFFPAQYMAAFLTYESQANKVSDWIPYLEDCRRTRIIDPKSPDQRTPVTLKTGIEVKPPDINLSRAEFAVVGASRRGASPLRVEEKVMHAPEERATNTTNTTTTTDTTTHIRFGLKAIKGVGDKAIDVIVKQREDVGPYTSIFDFCERVPANALNKATLENLVKCGAFDAVHGRDQRAAVFAALDGAVAAGSRLASDRAAGQGGLFMGGGGSASDRADSVKAKPTLLAKVAPWAEKELLAYEKEVLGFYASSHPLERWKFWTDAFATANTARLKDMPADTRVVLPAMIQSVRAIVVKNGRSAGQKMAILTVEDSTGVCECVLFTDNFAKYGHQATPEAVVFVLGRLDLSRGDPQVIIDRLVPVDGVPLDTGKVRLFLDEQRLNGEASRVLSTVADLLRADPRSTTTDAKKVPISPQILPMSFPVEIVIGTPSQVAVLHVDSTVKMVLAPMLFRAVSDQLGAGMVRVVGGFTVEKDKPKPWENKKRSRGEEE